MSSAHEAQTLLCQCHCSLSPSRPPFYMRGSLRHDRCRSSPTRGSTCRRLWPPLFDNFIRGLGGGVSISANVAGERTLGEDPRSQQGCSSSGVTATRPPLKRAAAAGVGRVARLDIQPLAIPCAAATNLPPVAEAGGPYETVVGRTIALDGRGSRDPDGTSSLLTFTWFVSSLQTPVADRLTGPTPTITLTRPGVYTVILPVPDEAGAASTPTPDDAGGWWTIAVTDKPPDTAPPTVTGVSTTPPVL